MIKAFALKRDYRKTRATTEKISLRTGKLSNTIEEIGKIKWQELIIVQTDLQSKINIFYETIKDIYDICQPIKKVKVKWDQAWMSPEIKNEIKLRQRYFKQNKLLEWKEQRNKVNNMINYSLFPYSTAASKTISILPSGKTLTSHLFQKQQTRPLLLNIARFP